MSTEPITHLEQVVAGATTPVTHLEKVIAEHGGGGGGGGSVSSVNGKTGAVVLSASDVGASPAETVVTVEGSTPTIEPQANTIYTCGELTSLTISNPPATGAYSIVFTSGATATDCDFPDSLQWQNDTVPTINPNKTYEIIVTNNRAVCGKFPVAEVSA